ncbi:hypothetical protein AAK894_04520 [Lachnospiraceae bacterium 46-61]
MTFFQRYEQLCAEKGTKPQNAEMIKIAGVSSGAISGWKKGSLPKGDVLCRLAKFFDVTTDYLLGLNELRNSYYANNNDSSVIQGNSSVAVNGSVFNSGSISASIPTNGEKNLSKEEIGILEVYRSLDIRDRAKFMNFVFDMEDKATKA